MARRPTGSIRERQTTKGKTWFVRISVNGERYPMTFAEADGWTRERVEDDVKYLVAQVRLGEFFLPPMLLALEKGCFWSGYGYAPRRRGDVIEEAYELDRRHCAERRLRECQRETLRGARKQLESTRGRAEEMYA